MKGTILLNYDDDVRKVEDEERTRFLRDVLEQMGVPIASFWTSDTSLSIDQRIKLRNMLATYSIQALDDMDGMLQIYVENEKVAEWNKPTYKLKRDLRQIDRKKQLYLEMNIEYWTIFEDQQSHEE